MERKQNANGDVTIITPPNKESIESINTGDYLVLLANDNSNVIMPRLFEFIKENICANFDIEGIYKLHTK